MPKILGNTRIFRFTATANPLPHDFQTEFGRVDYRRKTDSHSGSDAWWALSVSPWQCFDLTIT